MIQYIQSVSLLSYINNHNQFETYKAETGNKCKAQRNTIFIMLFRQTAFWFFILIRLIYGWFGGRSTGEHYVITYTSAFIHFQ